MQSYSPSVPWVQVVDQGRGRFATECRVCGQRAAGDEHFVDQFARAHTVHQAPQGSYRLGDLVASFAKPLSNALGLTPCTPCEARRRALNAWGARGGP